uniref:WD repeat-containing protein CG11141 n=1 Tax=Diabrotica virgifera virgifera TaxID=50390 RepID=A0A6P7GHJ9_DIAVI
MALYPNAIRQTLREWAPLTELFAKLPTKHQNGIFYQEIKLTCVDVLPEFIALGTNSGIVYWFDRNKKDMQRLRCENNISITALKIISTVDYMVACGNAAGNINIFQIPKSYPDNLPDSLKPKNKQVERYTVAGLHKASISAIDWSKNGMKLFSGDKNGGVVLTEIDFYMGAFETLAHLAIWKTLKEMGIPEKNIKELYSDIESHVLHNGITSEPITRLNGVKRGLYPPYYLTLSGLRINKDKLDRGVYWGLTNRLKDLDYADDIICLLAHRKEDKQLNINRL